MPTHIGITEGLIYPQPGFTPQRDEKGGWTASQSYGMLKATWGNVAVRLLFKEGASIIGLDPSLESFWGFLRVTSVVVSHEEGDHIYVTATFSGSPTTQFSDGEEGGISDDAAPIYRLSGSLGDMPISEHPKFKALAETEQIGLGRIISGEYTWGPDPRSGITDNFTQLIAGDSYQTVVPDPITSAEGIEFAKLITKGQTTYLFPTVTWTETTQGAGKLTAAQLNKLGKISTPRGGAPTPTSGRNWMLTGADQEQSGLLFQTTLQWTLSDADGHNDFLYDT
jgi:hypothetical protein